MEFPNHIKEKNRENPQKPPECPRGIFPWFSHGSPQKRSPVGTTSPHRTAQGLRCPRRFVTCSEIWALFLADDLLYSQRPQRPKRSPMTGMVPLKIVIWGMVYDCCTHIRKHQKSTCKASIPEIGNHQKLEMVGNHLGREGRISEKFSMVSGNQMVLPPQDRRSIIDFLHVAHRNSAVKIRVCVLYKALFYS